jgi:hypothetical protein
MTYPLTEWRQPLSGKYTGETTGEMSDTLFMQFYSRRKSHIFNLLNGFSDTYDLCRQQGDFYWMRDEPDEANWYQYDIYASKALPISRGTIYVSALDVNHLYQCWVWAKEHPEIRFVVGGPVVSERDTQSPVWDPAYVRVLDPEAIPGNLTLTGKSVEQWFGVRDFSGPWKLEVPAEIQSGSRIYFSYTLDDACFWSRCIYCNIGCHDRRFVRRRTEMAFEFRDLRFNGTKLVRLNTGSITPRQLRELLPILPRGNGFEYRTFMRPAAPENKSLLAALAICKGAVPDIMLGLGVEFPTQRMLAHVDKGFGPDELIQCLEICQRNHIMTNANVIVGWDNLTPADVTELEAFMKRVPTGSFRSMQLRWLYAHPYTAIHDHYHGKPVAFGPFYEGFSVELDEPQMLALNRQATDIFEQYAGIKQYKLEGLKSVRAKMAAHG